MADMKFMDLQLTPRFYPYGVRLDGRFVIKKKVSAWLDSTVYVAHDSETGMDCVLYVIGTADHGHRANAHAQFLASSKNVEGFPKMLHQFSMGTYENIVTTLHGEDMFAVLSRSVFHISKQNGIRFAHRLFTLINRIHQLGYVHRNIRTNTVRGGLDWQADFVVQIDNFFYAAPIDPKPSTYRMESWASQSLEVNLGQPYSQIDDFVAGLFVVMESQGIRPFLPLVVSRQDMIGAKMEFDENPEAFIQKDEMSWMVDLYEELKQQRVEGLNLGKIWSILNSAEPDFDPSTKIKWEFVSKESCVVKLTGDETKIEASSSNQPKNPIKVPQ